jgi:glycosyltransferase involved in cell wall biosynthesis
MPSTALILLARTGLLRLASAARVRQWLANEGASFPVRQRAEPRQLLVDVSVIHQHDAGTGIQRVVRSVLRHLQTHPPDGFTVRCVVAQSKRPYHYAQMPGQPGTQKVKVQPGDVFLGLDLVAHLLPRYLSQLLEWKLAGASLHFVVYDMLPLTHAAQFKAVRTRHFQRWAQLLAMVADSLLCISHSVQTDLQRWLSQNAGLTPVQIPTRVIPLGGDFYKDTQAAPSSPSPAVEQALSQLQGKHWALMVGTLEPRKCHAQVLDAFEHLWHQESQAALVLVGRPGWHTEQLQQRIIQHPQLNRKLYWFNSASDAELVLCYQQTTGVVVASLAEGYGLPLSEALVHGKPLLARDIPVFREVAGEHAKYFTDDGPAALSQTLHGWLTTPRPADAATNFQPTHTWAHATQSILQALGMAAITPAECECV